MSNLAGPVWRGFPGNHATRGSELGGRRGLGWGWVALQGWVTPRPGNCVPVGRGWRVGWQAEVWSLVGLAADWGRKPIAGLESERDY